MDLRHILALSMVKGIGPVFIKQKFNRVLSDNTCKLLIEEYKPEQVVYIDEFLTKADQIILCCANNGIKIISIVSENYPNSLRELNDPPTVIYAKGNISLIDKCVAIIGTRKSTLLGNKIAERLGLHFCVNHSICNGLVEGIDEHSIYSNGKILNNVVGIVSGGLCYPQTCTRQHIKIIEDVLSADGLIISEYPPMQKEDIYSGSKASRIQAGLSKGLILVQSSVNGGSKYTIAAFSNLNRPIGIIHYTSSEEYRTDAFSGNRLIVEKKNMGIAEMIGKKSLSKIVVKDIIVIENKDDYTIFERLLS